MTKNMFGIDVIAAFQAALSILDIPRAMPWAVAI